MGLKSAWKALWSRSAATSDTIRVVREPSPELPAPLLDVPDYSEIVAAVNAHHAEITQLRLEWAETLDKFTAWANRQAARDRVRMKASMRSMEPDSNEPDPDQLPLLHGSQPMPAGAGMEGIPGNGAAHRHPKADLYARIRRA